MIEVFVFFIFHLLAGLLERFSFLTLKFFGRLTQQFPILMVLGFGCHDAFTGDQLGGLRLASFEGHFHRFHEQAGHAADPLGPIHGQVGSGRAELPRVSRRH